MERIACLTLAIALAWTAAGTAAEPVTIADNSFYIEEAYNQEQGVVQNIFNLVPGWERGAQGQQTLDFLYTQEWPIFSQKHQLSYSIPLSRYDETAPGGATAGGLGDIQLNYRYQLLNDNEGDWFACAPRASLIFPTGEAGKGFGHGSLGYEFALPISKTFERGAIHLNARYTENPGSHLGVDPLMPFGGQDLTGYGFGGSAIYFLKPNFHLMLENVYEWNDTLDTVGTPSREFQALLVPGFRWAPYTEEAQQWVLGVGLPIGITPDAPDFGVFVYMSLEQRCMKERK